MKKMLSNQGQSLATNIGAITSISGVVTMSSREIAEYTDKRHPDIKRDIEKMCFDLKKDVSKFAHIYLDSMNRQQNEYLLDEELTLCLTSGYSTVQRMAIIKRWKELELASKPQVPETLAGALRLAADQAEQLEEKREQVLRLEQINGDLANQFVEGSTIPEFCKQLNGVNIQEVQNHLSKVGILVRTSKGFSPNGYTRDRYFVCRPYSYAVGKHANRVLVTKPGAKYLYKLYQEGKLPMKNNWDGVYSHTLIKH